MDQGKFGGKSKLMGQLEKNLVSADWSRQVKLDYEQIYCWFSQNKTSNSGTKYSVI